MPQTLSLSALPVPMNTIDATIRYTDPSPDVDYQPYASNGWRLTYRFAAIAQKKLPQLNYRLGCNSVFAFPLGYWLPRDKKSGRSTCL